MLQTDIIRNRWIRTYSDAEKYIAPKEEPEILYYEAVDPIDSGREYIETNIDIPEEEYSEESE